MGSEMCIRDRVTQQLRGGLWIVVGRECLDALVQDVDEFVGLAGTCLLYTSDAADERSSVDLGGRRLIKKKQYRAVGRPQAVYSGESSHPCHLQSAQSVSHRK